MQAVWPPSWSYAGPSHSKHSKGALAPWPGAFHAREGAQGWLVGEGDGAVGRPAHAAAPEAVVLSICLCSTSFPSSVKTDHAPALCDLQHSAGAGPLWYLRVEPHAACYLRQCSPSVAPAAASPSSLPSAIA